jgi:hypothetical protein
VVGQMSIMTLSRVAFVCGRHLSMIIFSVIYNIKRAFYTSYYYYYYYHGEEGGGDNDDVYDGLRIGRQL